MTRIFICLLGASLTSSLNAMQANKPNESIAYPLSLSTSLATDNEILYRQNIKYTLINNIARPKAWGSPLKKNQYSIVTEINGARTRSQTHEVDLKFTVKQGDNCIHKDRKLFVMPIDLGAYFSDNVKTDLGILKLTISVSSFPSSDDDDTDSSSDDDDLE